MIEANGAEQTIIHYFVDEAGDPTLFDRKGRIIVGDEGCSKYFILGKLGVDDPAGLTADLERLRADLLKDPYFKGIPSMSPSAKKTAIMFHAKDDVPEVRREVFKVLLSKRPRFYAVVRDKQQVVSFVRQQNERDPNYHYSENELYDALVCRLFCSRLHRADQFNICFSKRGKSDRTAALKKALEEAVKQFERDFGIANHSMVHISHASPPQSGGLQAVDYFLWAIQRFYEYAQTEKRETECRYVELIQPLIGEINEPDWLLDGRLGVLWNPWRPLSLAGRQPANSAKKKPGI